MHGKNLDETCFDRTHDTPGSWQLLDGDMSCGTPQCQVVFIVESVEEAD